MRRLFISSFCCLLIAICSLIGAIPAMAQTYGNEWIDFNRTYFKIKVARDGLYRIPYSTLQAAPGFDVNNIPASQINMYHNGQAVPFYVTSTGILSSSDFIEFYGQRNDGSLDSLLYNDPNWQPQTGNSLFNDTSIYYLTWNTVDAPILISNIANDLSNLPAKEPYCFSTIMLAYQNQFLQGKPNYLGTEPLFESIYDEGEGYYDNEFRSSSKSYTIATPGFYNSPSVQATLTLSITGTTNVTHNLSVNFNTLPQLVNTSFVGYKLNKYSWDFASSSLQSNNVLSLNAFGGSSDGEAVSQITLKYPHAFNFNGSSRAAFSIPGTSGAKYLEINNYSNANTAPILYDLTNNLRIVGANGTAPFRFKLPAAVASNERNLFISSQSSNDIITVTSMERVNFRNYGNPTYQGNFVIVSHPSLQNDGNGNDWVSEYAKYRSTAAGGAYNAIVVDINQLYDQFAYGVAKSPLALRNFIQYARGKWLTKPEYVFLIGKGREYANTNYNQNMRVSNGAYVQCLIPTWGYPGSDNLLSANSLSSVPQVPMGRLSASSGEDIRKYLVKVKDYEQVQNEKGDPYQTIANKLWMKQILHLGGGYNASEQATFKYYLDSYEAVIEDTLYGGNVTEFFKTSSNPIQLAQSDLLSSMINNGVSLITFFGHSSPNSFDFSVDDPDNYQNYKRYPVILSNGCFTGNIYNPSPGISEDFVINEDRGSIAFLATTALSSSVGLNTFSTNFYNNLGRKVYNMSLGDAIKSTTADVEQCCNQPFNMMIVQGLTLHGDPSIKVNTHDEPDYVLEPQMVSFNPSVVTVEQDSFLVNVIVTNLGKSINDSIVLRIERGFPDGATVVYNKKVKAAIYQDTIQMAVQTGDSRAFGLNNLKITIDADDKVKNELSETNNTLGLTINIFSEDVYPIYPYEFAIVPTTDITLKASTANAFAGVKNYIMQIDTTELFNSPLQQSTTISQSGGVLKWKPNMVYRDSVVYYWRVAVDTSGTTNNATWHGFSFIYLNGSYPGWNQSHYFQYGKDNYPNNVYLDNDRLFKFVDDGKLVTVRNGSWYGAGGSLPDDQIGYSLNGTLKQRWNCGGDGFFSGLVLAVFDPNSGQNWVSRYADVNYDFSGCNPNNLINTVHKNIHCKPRDVDGFDFPTASLCQQDNIVDFINSVPAGHYILVYSVNNPNYQFFSSNLMNALRGLGSSLIDTLVNRQGAPWAFFVQKGDTSTASEQAGTAPTDVLNFSATFNARWYRGDVTGTVIGPAFDWHSFHWRYKHLESPTYDKQSVKVTGIRANGTERVLANSIAATDTTLDFVDAKEFPFIRLELNLQDDTSRTPSQLAYWRVLYDKVPEAALNPSIFFNFKGDTLALGETLDLTVAVENVSEIDMDSLLVKYTILNANRGAISEYVRYDSLKAFQSTNLNYKFNTNCNGCLTKANSLVVEINPDDDQREQYHFNNIGILPFGISSDITNPLLDVTFDGVHILNGDIVSAKPEILIRLKDENKYLGLDDTALLNIFLKYPNGSLQRINFSDPSLVFTPAVPSQLNKNNQAEVKLNKTFPDDGTYELLIQAADKSNNESGAYGNAAQGYDYRVEFEIVNKPAITNVLNYPNPFTTNTRFVFTLTGSQIPTFFKIQILTVSGKVVREIMKDELGPIRIGRNITEFAWDGRDQYGDPLANGLYLYRVVTSIDGKALDKMETSADKYFKSGFGKMYMAR